MNMDLSDETKNQASLLPELWGMIFRKFDTDFIRKNLTLVCKEWHDFIRKDPMISGELKIKRDQSTENVNLLLASYPVLKRLELYESWENLKLEDLDFEQCPDLEKVVVKDVTEIDHTLVSNAGNTFPRFQCFPDGISFHPKENLENVNIGNIHSMHLPWNIQQSRGDTKMMEKFDFKAFGINLKNNTESLTIDVNNSGDLVKLQKEEFRYSQVLTELPGLKSLTMNLVESSPQISTNAIPNFLKQCCPQITAFEFEPLFPSKLEFFYFRSALHSHTYIKRAFTNYVDKFLALLSPVPIRI